MKKLNKFKKQKTIKELAGFFDKELTANLPVTVLPNGAVGYKDYLIKQTKDGNWGIYNVLSKDLLDQFFLKSCALMAAKAYSNVQLEKYQTIKQLDNRYWANHCDMLVYKKNIKTAKEFERYLILLNKLENSEAQTEHYKEEISRMFKWSFV
jgi:hypothetical protein